MVDIALVGISTYWLSRLWADRLTALLCAVALVTMIPVAISAVSLPYRHYLEGMILATISLYGFLRSEESDSRFHWWLLLSIICYGLALTAKEVFAPLAVALFFLSHRPVTERIYRLLGHITLVILYCGWRYYMLGQLIGGYDGGGSLNNSNPDAIAKDVMVIFSSLPRALSFSTPGSWTLLFLFGAVLTVGIVTRSFRWVAAIALLVCVIVPIIPVAWIISMFGIDGTVRYFMVIAWVMAICLSILITKLSYRWMRLTALIILASASTLMAHASYEMISERSDPGKFSLPDCYRFVWAKSDDSLLLPRGTFTADGLTAFAHLKRAYTGGQGPAIYAGNISLPSNYEDKSVYVQTKRKQKEDCFRLRPERKKVILRQAHNARIDTSSSDKVHWLANGVAWELDRIGWELAEQKKGRVFLTISDGEASYRRRLKQRKGQFVPLQHELFIRGIHAPATMHIERIMPGENIIYTTPAPVPDSLFGFWKYARTTKDEG